MSISQLEHEFDKRRADFVADHLGEWVLLAEGKTDQPQFFSNEIDAARAGYRDERGRRFLVKEVLAKDRVVTLSNVALHAGG